MSYQWFPRQLPQRTSSSILVLKKNPFCSLSKLLSNKSSRSKHHLMALCLSNVHFIKPLSVFQCLNVRFLFNLRTNSSLKTFKTEFLWYLSAFQCSTNSDFGLVSRFRKCNFPSFNGNRIPHYPLSRETKTLMFYFHTFVLEKCNEKKSMPSVRKSSRKVCGQEKEKTSKYSRAYLQMRVKIKEGIEIKLAKGILTRIKKEITFISIQ